MKKKITGIAASIAIVAIIIIVAMNKPKNGEHSTKIDQQEQPLPVKSDSTLQTLDSIGN